MARYAYADRDDAGRHLATRMAHLAATDPVILALPRGGVPVAREVALALNAPLHLLLVRKLGMPRCSEVAIGAIVDGTPPQVVLNHDFIAQLGLDTAYVEAETAKQRTELERRRTAFGRAASGRAASGRAASGADVAAPDVRGRHVIIVDDGVATGSTLEAALRGVRDGGAARITVAVPVAAPDALRRLEPLADEWICPLRPDRFRAVGEAYGDFAQLEDDDVIRLLQEG